MGLAFPWAVAESKDVMELNGEIIVVMKDGSRYIYNDESQTIRRVSDNSERLSDTQIDREFGLRLKRMMAFRHMTQAELASSVGITQGMVSQYIHGYSSPSFRVVDRMAKALGCSADDLRLLY